MKKIILITLFATSSAFAGQATVSQQALQSLSNDQLMDEMSLQTAYMSGVCSLGALKVATNWMFDMAEKAFDGKVDADAIKTNKSTAVDLASKNNPDAESAADQYFKGENSKCQTSWTVAKAYRGEAKRRNLSTLDHLRNRASQAFETVLGHK